MLRATIGKQHCKNTAKDSRKGEAFSSHSTVLFAGHIAPGEWQAPCACGAKLSF